MGYVPSLKEKHESKIVGSKAIESKGGSIRYTLQGEYEGRKTLPKTVSKADFEGVYGFDAKAAEVKEAFGFGKEDEEEAEPKTQEFTVVMQEGDKLELTDIEDDEPKEEDNDSNEEKEAEWNQDGENTLDGGYTGNAEYEAVSAKVTRPVKEEEEEETEEGLSTLAKVGIGLGALAVGALVLGAEGEYSCPHCSTDLEVDGLDMSEKFTCPDCDGLIYESRNSGGHYPGDFMAEDEGESDYWTGDSASWRAEYVSGAETFEARTTRKSFNNPITDESDDKMIATPDGLHNTRRYERDSRNKTGRKRLSNPKKMDWDNANLSQDFTKTKKREKEDLRNIKKHGNAESFEATTGYGYDDPSERMTDEEGWLEMYDDYLEDEDSPMTLEEYKKWVIEAREEDYQMQVKYEQRLKQRLKDDGRDMDGNPIKEAESGSKNLKMALGITAVGIGLAAVLGKDKITKLFDKLGL